MKILILQEIQYLQHTGVSVINTEPPSAIRPTKVGLCIKLRQFTHN